MNKWTEIVGLSVEPAGFSEYVRSFAFQAWRPEFIVLHNTAIPRLSDWHEVPGRTRMELLTTLYKDTHKWSAGPHLFIADDVIWTFTPLNIPGIHSPSWNEVSLGVEVVGDYETEPFEGAIRENTVEVLTCLHRVLRLDPGKMVRHGADPRTTHKRCPGPNLNMPALIREISERLGVAD